MPLHSVKIFACACKNVLILLPSDPSTEAEKLLTSVKKQVEVTVCDNQADICPHCNTRILASHVEELMTSTMQPNQPVYSGYFSRPATFGQPLQAI